MSILDKLEQLNSDQVKQVFCDLLKEYLTPSYGSMAKRDFDILLFTKLQQLGLVEQNPSIYSLITQLKLTRSKARNLLYEAKLRQTDPSTLDDELKQILVSPIFLKEGDKIGLEIDNPYLTDYLRSRLRDLNHITDGSFSRELVKLTPEAFASLIESYLNEQEKRAIHSEFVRLGVKPDSSLNGILTNILKGLLTKFLDKAGEKIAESAVDYLLPLLNANLSEIPKKFRGFFST